LKIKRRSKGNTGSVVKSIPLFLLVLFIVAVAFCLVLESVFHLASALPLIASLGASPQGVYLGSFSLGFLSIFLVLILAGLSMWMHHTGGASVSKAGAGTAIVMGLLLGSGFAMAPVPQVSNPGLYSVQDSGQGFRFVVYYNSTTLTIGKNLTVKYVLTDDSYRLITPYYLFGGQFSMVFFNSTGGQVVAFRSPITFRFTNTTTNVELSPGEVWNSLLSFNGTIISLKGTHSIIRPGIYSLSSYAVLQDANVSLYVDLHPPDISVAAVS
jgi:hypothetical protein